MRFKLELELSRVLKDLRSVGAGLSCSIGFIQLLQKLLHLKPRWWLGVGWVFGMLPLRLHVGTIYRLWGPMQVRFINIEPQGMSF